MAVGPTRRSAFYERLAVPAVWYKEGEAVSVFRRAVRILIVQTYDRTLTANGLRLDFQRVRSGKIEKQLKGGLIRVVNEK